MARKTAKPRLVARDIVAHDSLSNFAASLNGGKDKAANDAFFLQNLPRDQIEAMYRGDWLARKVVDIVPYDSIREWRSWQGARADVVAIERTERRLGLRKAVQRAMILGRLYGGGALVIGTDETDPASLARPLDPEGVGPDGLRFLHVVSRWQLGTSQMRFDPLDPHYGEPVSYQLAAPTRGELALHPSRVIRFLGNPLPDPALADAQLWSDSVLQTLYDAIHAVALTAAGSTSLMHEAKVDVVTVPNLSEHLSNAATTAQLSARFSYAAAMKSINNLLLLGDGETWSRQRIDFGGLPEMVRTFLQMAAGAADIPVTRLLGQSPSGLSATGESDTRNYYDMIAARQELDLRPQLERLDALLLRSAGVDPDTVSFSFRPLWQLNATDQAAVALSKAQATQIYAGLGLWPAAVTAGLVQGQLLEDGTYPGAATVFGAASNQIVSDYDPDQPRNNAGEWTSGGGATTNPDVAQYEAIFHEHERRRRRERHAAKRRAREEHEKAEGKGKEAGEAPRTKPEEHPASTPAGEATPASGQEEGRFKPHPSDPDRGSSIGVARAPIPDGPYGSIVQAEGVMIKVMGKTLTAEGSSYEQGIRSTFGTGGDSHIFEDGVGFVDDIIDEHGQAIEANYTDDFEKSIYNPDYQAGFPHTEVEDTTRELADRANHFENGVIIFTNSNDLAVTYGRLLAEHHVVKFRFIIAGATR